VQRNSDVFPLASEKLAGIVGLIDARGLETDGLEAGLRELGAILALFERAGLHQEEEHLKPGEMGQGLERLDVLRGSLPASPWGAPFAVRYF
jgi:hypothetical protein